MQLTNYMYQIDSQIDTAFTKILTSAHNFQKEGNNWTFEKIISFDICNASYQPILGSSFIELPEILKRKKAIVNIRNKNQKCFLYSV